MNTTDPIAPSNCRYVSPAKLRLELADVDARIVELRDFLAWVDASGAESTPTVVTQRVLLIQLECVAGSLRCLLRESS